MLLTALLLMQAPPEFQQAVRENSAHMRKCEREQGLELAYRYRAFPPDAALKKAARQCASTSPLWPTDSARMREATLSTSYYGVLKCALKALDGDLRC